MSSKMVCPACGSGDVRRLIYTSQGGLLWTPFLNFLQCRTCDSRFSGRTGQLDPQVPKVMRVVSMLVIMCFVGLVVGFALALSARGQATRLRLVTREVSLGKPHAGEIRLSREFSPNGLHVAYSVRTAEGEFVVVDGAAGRTYTEIPRYPLTEAGVESQIIFSPDGGRVAYVARRGARFLVVADSREGPEFDNIRVGAPRFSPDGRRLAYVGQRGGKKFVVDGAEGRPYDDVDDLLFTRGGRHLAYTARRDGKHFVVVGDVESQGYDQLVGAARRVEDDSPFYVSLLLGGPHGLSVLAARGDELLRVELEIAEGPEREVRSYSRPRPRGGREDN
jgi:hypothetical protein